MGRERSYMENFALEKGERTRKMLFNNASSAISNRAGKRRTASIAAVMLIALSLLAAAPYASALTQYGVTTVGSTNYPTGTFGTTSAVGTNAGGLRIAWLRQNTP